MSKAVPKEIAERIKAAAKLEDIIPDLKKNGPSGLICKCPFCGKDGKGKGLSITPSKQIWKCFSDGKGGQGAISYIMALKNIKYPEALRYLADHYNISIDDPLPTVSETSKKSKKPTAKSKLKTFCDEQLESSGLTKEDIMVEINYSDKIVESPAFRSGTRNQYGDIILGNNESDMLIYYYDLDGKQVMYRRKNEKTQLREFIRVRWSNPMLHLDKDGNPGKYQSPYGSGSHIYIPEKVRKLYKNRRKVKTLFIQEGEKKAEKCCKHNIISVGISGINNLGSRNTFPPELQQIIKSCEVQEVVFMLDSDWCDLSLNLKNASHVDNRPRSFFYAVKNYKDYMRTLYNVDIAVDIYFGHLRINKKEEKGIDDFLNGTLKNSEAKMSADIKKAMHDKEGIGAYVNIHKITVVSDTILADMWHLNDADKFAEFHKEKLSVLQEFSIRNIKRRFNEEGELEMDQPILPEEKYWAMEGKGDFKRLIFKYTRCYRFLQNRGFWRIWMKSETFKFIRIENKIVEIVDNYSIKDFITEFTEELKDKEDVQDMLYRGGPQYLGFEKLSNLKYFYPSFERAGRIQQNLFFKDKIWQINDEEIKEIQYSDLEGHVWKDKIIKFDSEVIEPLVEAIPVTKENIEKLPGYKIGEISLGITTSGLKCDFLCFLLNTSNFFWKKTKKKIEITDNEEAVINRHLLNKLTAIGYLLHDYKNDSELKAVIAMDGMLSEVGASQGRTGKSIIGVAIEQVIPQTYIAAKSRKLTEDNFLFGEVSEKTKNVFLDDVRANIDFEFFFPLITGKLKVNPKGGQPFTLDKKDTPKLFISTNHAINGEGSSFSDRQVFMAFSDFYNDNHKPVDDFGKNFFSEWGKEQWNLFYNLMANCLMLYFRSLKEGWSGRGQGVIEPPMDSIEKRRLRQQMGEDFLAWADEYFSDEKTDSEIGSYARLNDRIERKEMNNDLLDKNQNLRKYLTPSGFSKRIKAYCKYHKYHLNYTKHNREGLDFYDWIKDSPGESFIGGPDKSGGIEYITIATNNHLKS